ncbi:hypothetical protein AQUCO_03900023v1 [Aquilegia coerulea]|uniref:Seipin n=1 Tax=Aquilegia coerulea TaxID=218851 RepID=A0A2G5CRH6_AQUCA|nr:hypothetical protein AQUCO_03900023v1 [Aquilegia coerulea]
MSKELDEIVSSFLMFLGGLVIRTIGFQINAFINFFTFPIWLMYCSFMFVVDPFRILKWAHNCIIVVFLGMWCSFCERAIALPVKGQKSLLKMTMKFCWGFFWSAYVCFLLFGLLVLGFVLGGVTMRYIVEEPIQITETLNFDYTKSSPVALVPIMSCPSVSCGLNCKENIELENYVGSRVIPPNQNLKLAISLTLPESDYNRKLGIFQVKVDLLSTNGEVTASPSYPCMLQFKSQLIRYAQTFLRSLPLLAGYTSESQTLIINMRGFTEGNEPTSCLKVILEQRAEFQPSSGIPEIYAASLVLESELPLIKQIIWHWRKTIFVWISMASFAVELMFMLICCRPIIVPRAQSRQKTEFVQHGLYYSQYLKFEVIGMAPFSTYHSSNCIDEELN